MPQSAMPQSAMSKSAMPKPAVPTLRASPLAPAGSLQTRALSTNPALWIGAIFAGIALCIVAVQRHRRLVRRALRGAPVPSPTTDLPPATPAGAVHPAGGPAVQFHASRLDLSLRNATLRYRIGLTNTGAVCTSDFVVDVELVAAHRDLRSGPTGHEAPRHSARCERIVALPPDQETAWDGEVRLPLADIRPIAHGQAALLVPLIRINVQSGSDARTTATFVVGGSAAADGRVIPFRLDHGPRSHTELASRLVQRTNG